MYASIEMIYLVNWFMYGQDALNYYRPEYEKPFEYELPPLDE